MNKLKTRLIVIILTFAVGISAVAAFIYFQKPASLQIILPNSGWEPSVFGSANFKGGINQATEMAGIEELRKKNLPEGDAEIRIWREGDALEAVILKRTGGVRSAFRLKAIRKADSFATVDVAMLKEPKSGWELFWKQISGKGLLELPDQSEIHCDAFMVDMIYYVVEINQNRIYRTYRYTSPNKKCAETERMDEIGEIIGLEFDSGNEQCKTTEWFACTTYQRKFKQTDK